ncbi:MAG TPA: LLM class flavin-dependent oxidoreductase, partial [Acidimicrobiales bacterium]
MTVTRPVKQIHLAAHFPGVNNTTVWSDPGSGSQTDFSSFVHLARTAERGKFDFFFLAEGLRLREHRGHIFDLDVVGRPDSLTVLAALAAVTDRIGLAATLNTTFNEPYEVARQFASLDHLSGGRAAWNVVTSWDAFTGENFRRGGFLPQNQR